MPMKFLGKVIFPHLAPWQQKKQASIMVWVVLSAVLFAVTVVVIMLFQNSRR